MSIGTYHLSKPCVFLLYSVTDCVPSRREIHEIEKRKREKRKRQEKRKQQQEQERQDRMWQMLNNPQMMMMQNGMMPPMYNMPSPQQGYAQNQGMANGGRQPEPDQSGNPYAPRGGNDRY
jgi:hypothetical protein